MINIYQPHTYVHIYIYIINIYIYIVFHVSRFPPFNIWQFLDIYLHPMCFFRCLGHFVYSDPWIAQEIPRIWMVYEDWKCFVLLKMDDIQNIPKLTKTYVPQWQVIVHPCKICNMNIAFSKQKPFFGYVWDDSLQNQSFCWGRWKGNHGSNNCCNWRQFWRAGNGKDSDSVPKTNIIVVYKHVHVMFLALFYQTMILMLN